MASSVRGLLALAAVAPVSAQAPEDPLGVVTIPPGEPVVIAGWGVNSGADASLGTDWMNSMKVVADDRGEELLGHPLELVFEDGLCTPEGGATAAQKLAADTTIVGLIGSACSDETVGGIAAITNAGLTTISPSNTRPALTAEDRGPEFAGYLRTAHNDLVQGAFVADFAYNVLGARTAATLHDGSAYAEALQQVFQDNFVAAGGSIVTVQAVQKGQTDMKPVLTAIANAPAPDVLYFPIFTAEGAFVIAQSKEVAGLENTALIGSDGMFSQDMVNGAGPAAVGVYLSSPAVTGDAYTEFLAKYEEINGVKPPQAFHAHGCGRHEHPPERHRAGRGAGRRRHALCAQGRAARRRLRHQGLPGADRQHHAVLRRVTAAPAPSGRTSSPRTPSTAPGRRPCTRASSQASTERRLGRRTVERAGRSTPGSRPSVNDPI